MDKTRRSTCRLKPIPGIEWTITTICNYHCSYCEQKSLAQRNHCSDEIIDAVFRLLPTLGKSWLIKVIGGESFVHPRFFEICQAVVRSGHKICLTTNFSPSFSDLQQLINLCGSKLKSITASLHLDQIKDLDDFQQKALLFNRYKNPATDFRVESVVTRENLDTIKGIESKFKESGIEFKVSPLKEVRTFVKYDEKTERYIGDRLSKKQSMIRDNNFFGTLCYTGKLFFRIMPNGEVLRCYNPHPLYYDLGNIRDGNFKTFSQVKPCLSRLCTCIVPIDRNMILFGKGITRIK